MTYQLGELSYLNLRRIWVTEDGHFTPWLAENLHELGNKLGVELELIGTEASVGDFSLDVLARDLGSGRDVIIENQFGATDHDHLGKLLTYAAAFDASAIVWIAESVRDEHRQALEWLNQRTDLETNFFAVVVEVLQIGDSDPAVNFRLVVFPNQWGKIRRQQTTSHSPRMQAYQAFFQQLIDVLREEHHFTGARVGQPQSWYQFASGHSGISYAASFPQGNLAKVEVYIDRSDYDENKHLFDWLKAQSEAIERSFGQPLEWDRLDDRRASRVFIGMPGSIESSVAELGEIREWMVQHLLRLKRTFDPFLQVYRESPAGQPVDVPPSS